MMFKHPVPVIDVFDDVELNYAIDKIAKKHGQTLTIEARNFIVSRVRSHFHA